MLRAKCYALYVQWHSRANDGALYVLPNLCTPGANLRNLPMTLGCAVKTKVSVRYALYLSQHFREEYSWIDSRLISYIWIRYICLLRMTGSISPGMIFDGHSILFKKFGFSTPSMQSKLWPVCSYRRRSASVALRGGVQVVGLEHLGKYRGFRK